MIFSLTVRKKNVTSKGFLRQGKKNVLSQYQENIFLASEIISVGAQEINI